MSTTITPNCNVQSPNFKGHYVVQVAKKAFKSPENLTECSKLFGKEVDKCTGEKIRGKLGAWLALFNKKIGKTATDIESPSYSIADKISKKIGVSLHWFRQNTGLAIKDAANKDYHTFNVYTKDEKVKFIDACRKSMKNSRLNGTEAAEKYPNDIRMGFAYAQAKNAVDIDNYLTEAMKDVPVKEFKIENLNELKGVVEKMEY